MTLHDSLTRENVLLHVMATGAGPTFLYDLWSNPGASKYLVGTSCPYSRTQLHSLLGHTPDSSYVSVGVAYDLAMASYIRAAEHKVVEGLDGDPIGVGITAAVASTRIPRGVQGVHIAVISKNKVLNQFFEFEPKEERRAARIEQDAVISDLAKELLTQSLSPKSDTDALHTDEEEYALERFYKYPVFKTNGTRCSKTSNGVYLPASLNPIHEGHRSMCLSAENHLSTGPSRIKATYLVSSKTPHKGELSVQEMLLKVGMLRAERWDHTSRPVEFTRDEPLFIDKAQKRPGSVFLIGADTMQRMLEPKWYPDSSVEETLVKLKNAQAQFLVMGRVIDGDFITCRDIAVPWVHQDLFRPFGGRMDISSTELRNG